MEQWRITITNAALLGLVLTSAGVAQEGHRTTLTVNPSALAFTAVQNATVPASQTLTISASSRVSFSASASVQSGGRSWLSISPSGSLTTNRTLTVSVNQSGVTPGSYSGRITLASNGRTTTVPVTLTVNAPTLNVSPTSLAFTATAGGSNPASQSLTVSASAPVSFSASASVQSGGTNWLSISPSGNLTTNRTLTVSVNPAGVAPGSYNGTIALFSSGKTTTVPVGLTVQAGLTVSPLTMTFNGTLNTNNPLSQTLAVTAPVQTAFTASAMVQSGSRNWLQISPSGSLTTNRNLAVSVSLSGLVAGNYQGTISLVSSGGTTTVPVIFNVSSSSSGGGGTGNTGYKLIGWNDLGMHCYDGKDYSVFAVLPPYNTIHVHLLDSTGKLVTTGSGYSVTYQGVTDPLSSTINTTSIGKTNFWSFAAALGFGSLLPDVGLKGFAMPGSGNSARAMNFSTADNTFLAEGIPITNWADNGTVNYFPMMRLTAKNASGTVLATTDIVVPTSDEMTCKACHATSSGVGAALPSGGGVNHSDPAKDVKLNILRKHDQQFAGTALFKSASAAMGYNATGLEATTAAKPILCAACHGSNALGLAGVSGIPPLTTAMHSRHAAVVDPATSQTMDSGTTRESCYRCHPGPNTQCVRGAMATLKTAGGANAIECQSCHGPMSNVARTGRTGWLDEPACQSCHTGTASQNSGQIAYTSVFSTGVTVRVAADQTFATNADTPAAGLSLYRFSKGHGGLQCEACHGSTHAEYITAVANDNVQSTNLQGHAGMLAECSACHGASVPTTTNGGPHGLHPIGSSWVSRHPDVAEHGTTACQACHGTDYRGTILSKTQADRSMAGRSFPRGTVIGCYSCHNGPNGG